MNNQNSQNHTEIKVVEREGIEREVLGYLVNVKIRGCLSFLGKLFCISSRHWLVIKKINNEYYILDSKDKKPIKLGSGEKA